MSKFSFSFIFFSSSITYSSYYVRVPIIHIKFFRYRGGYVNCGCFNGVNCDCFNGIKILKIKFNYQWCYRILFPTLLLLNYYHKAGTFRK